MLSLKTPAALLFLTILAVGCSENGVTPTGTADTPVLNFSNGPASPGFHIVRFDLAGYGAFWSDESAGLTAFAGFDPVDVCDGPPFAAEVVSIQDNISPTDADRIISLVHGDDLPGSVWGFTGGLFPNCPTILSGDPIVEGLVDLRATDNDLLVFLRPNNNANAFGFNVRGAFSAHLRCVWDGEDLATLTCNTKIVP